jgi:N-acetylmuramoyl-L-alanine amidase
VRCSLKNRFAAAAAGSVLGAFLSGCATNSYSPLGGIEEAEMTPPTTAQSPPPREENPEIIVLPPEPAPVVGLDKVDEGPLPILTNTPVVVPPAISFGRGWIPLTTWSARCAIGKPERTTSGANAVYQIQTRSGTCVLTIGSRLMRWNGTAVWLGFAPHILRGEPHIHALDAEKTLLPLSEAQSALPTSVKTIVLDPGHGGADSGTRGAHNQLEKDYTLDWALRTERLLTNAGWTVFLTRRGDADVTLAERVAFADRVHADLFLSLHFNSAFPQTQPSGIETYCLTPSGSPSTLLRGYNDDERAAYPNNAFDAANVEWAFRLHQSLLKESRAHDDGVKRARFMSVLRYQNRPAVLVEGGFLSNLQDAANIQSENYRELLAKALAAGLK